MGSTFQCWLKVKWEASGAVDLPMLSFLEDWPPYLKWGYLMLKGLNPPTPISTPETLNQKNPTSSKNTTQSKNNLKFPGT